VPKTNQNTIHTELTRTDRQTDIWKEKKVKNVATVVAAENTDVIWLKKVMYSYN